MPLARRNPQEWRGGLLPYQLGGLLDPAIEQVQAALQPEQWTLTGWPSLEALQAAGAQRGPLSEQDVASMAVDMANPFAKIGGLLGHTVWHGSPHKWDVPDISKVGTGEGAQAYGHGFYSAEAPEVAESYADTLGSMYKGHYLENGKVVDQMQASEWYQSAADGTLEQDYKAFQKAADEGRISQKDPDLEEIRRLRGKTVEYVSTPEQYGGHLYKLDIPDEDISKYLDWDKPLSEQPEAVQEALNPEALGLEMRKIGNGYGYYFPDGGGWVGLTMASPDAAIREYWKTPVNVLHNNMGAWLGDKLDVAEFLQQRGIPGIRYLDGSSRDAGEGTYNYVTFDPSRIKVLERQ